MCGSCSNIIPLRLQKINIPDGKNKNPFRHMMKYKSYLHSFDTNKTEIINRNTEIEFSSFALFGLLDSYITIKNNLSEKIKEYYVVCPVYIDKESGKILDTQLAVTGTCYYNEDEYITVSREVSEEVGLFCDKSIIHQIVISENNNKTKRKECTFICDITNATYFDKNINIFTQGIDDKTKKIQVVLFGKIDNLLEIYKNVKNRPLSNDFDTIRYVRFISMKEFF